MADGDTEGLRQPPFPMAEGDRVEVRLTPSDRGTARGTVIMQVDEEHWAVEFKWAQLVCHGSQFLRNYSLPRVDAAEIRAEAIDCNRECAAEPPFQTGGTQ